MEFINQFITITKIQRKDSKLYTDKNTVTHGNWDFLWIDKISFLLYEQQEFGMHGLGFNHRKLAPKIVDLIKKCGCHTQRKLGCHCSTITKAMDIFLIPP